MTKALRIVLLLCLVSFPALAEEATDNKTYSPEYCDFTASFPEEPAFSRNCEDPETKENCYDLVSYTKVFNLSSTVRVDIICNPSNTEMYEGFTPEVMKATVRAMTKGTVIEAYEIGARQANGYRQASLLGKGRKGLHDTIYIAQLWLAENSIMSVEAEVSGEQIDEADQTFADILKTIGYSKEINGETSEPAKEELKDKAE